MAGDKHIDCDCGYRLRAQTEDRQVAEVRRHAWKAHRISFSPEEALAVLLRRELEGSQWTSRVTLEDTTQRKEQR